MIAVFRIQDADGRGPWKPGLSKYWVDDDGPVAPIQETIMDLAGGLDKLKALPAGWYYGCACKTAQKLADWFTPVEAIRLSAMGYFPVKMMVDKILFESDKQVLVARRRSLATGYQQLSWAEIMSIPRGTK